MRLNVASRPGWSSCLMLLLGMAVTVAMADDEKSSSLPEGPDFKAVLDLPGTGSPEISPDGKTILYTVRRTDWEGNRYDTEIWMARVGQEPFQLTRTKDKSSTNPEWSPDGKWIGFLADRGDGTQVQVIRITGGEAVPVTQIEDGVSSFHWSPDGNSMAVAITEPLAAERKTMEETYGKYAVEDREFQMTHLWVLDVQSVLASGEPANLPEEEEEETGEGKSGADEDEVEKEEDTGLEPFRRLTAGDGFTVGSYEWSPDSRRIAFQHTPDPRVESFSEADISVVDVAVGEVRVLVERPGPDGDPLWSPDGRWILFETGNEKTTYYTNSELAKVRAEGGEPVLLTGEFDEDVDAAAWLEDDIWFQALDRTSMSLYRLSSSGGTPRVVEGLPPMVWGVSFSEDGRTLALDAGSPDTWDEIYRVTRGKPKVERITRLTDEFEDWPLGSREVIEWKSRDGATVEGVLLKPPGFDPSRKHPLLVIIHGGPAWLSFPRPVYSYVYPVQQWLARGAVIMMPNYRGSAGYGEGFRSLNVRNLGVGDAWDVITGVDHLIQQGFVDPERMGAMGWSQGGYISAFLATTSDRFKAISVGAGISNWMTYYVNTDIHPFTRHYLEGTPWNDPSIYDRTSPMTYINKATTPTLIQHGEFDRRVPTPNAYELFQGLQDVGVETELIIYKGFGHGITKPKERLAAVWHNWQWFARYIWDEEVEIPAE